MKINNRTLALASLGLVSLPGIVQAEEKQNNLLTSLSSTTISGYVDTSAHWNLGTGNANVPGFLYSTAGKSDGFNLNKVKLSIEKPLDESQWAAGYKADLQFGPDANVFGTTSTGLATSDFAIQQAYVALRAPVGNGLDFKMGVFDSVIGYESHDSVNNPNYTRSYGVNIEPHTHTGLLATYQLSEAASLSAGIANTFGPTINARAHNGAGNGVGTPYKAESYKTYMASIALTAPEKWGWVGGSGLYAGLVNGYNAGAGTGVRGADQTSLYVGGTLATPVKGLKLGASYDAALIGAQPGVSGSQYANATAIYASFALPDTKLTLHARGEYFTQSGSAAAVSPSVLSGQPGEVLAFTGTVQYDLWKNVLSRLEFRWDHQADGLGHAYGAPSAPGAASGPGTRRNAVLIAANVVYKF